MISHWARAALTHRPPEPDTANPGDAYRQRVQADLRRAEAAIDRDLTQERRTTIEAALGYYGVTQYEQDALDGAQDERQTTAALAWLTGGRPSDNGHMSPWDAAQQMWGNGQ